MVLQVTNFMLLELLTAISRQEALKAITVTQLTNFFLNSTDDVILNKIYQKIVNKNMLRN